MTPQDKLGVERIVALRQDFINCIEELLVESDAEGELCIMGGGALTRQIQDRVARKAGQFVRLSIAFHRGALEGRNG